MDGVLVFAIMAVFGFCYFMWNYVDIPGNKMNVATGWPRVSELKAAEEKRRADELARQLEFIRTAKPTHLLYIQCIQSAVSIEALAEVTLIKYFTHREGIIDHIFCCKFGGKDIGAEELVNAAKLRMANIIK